MFRWVDQGGQPVSGDFPTQADAEAWLTDSYEDLAEDGVETVTLRRDDHTVYGPMSLAEAD